MGINKDPNPRIDKTRIVVSRLTEQTNDRNYWLLKTPDERFETIELMRQINCDYDPSAGRLQRVFEVVELQ